MKKISFILAAIVIVVAGYLLFQATNPYYGLVTEIEVQSDEGTVELLQTQLDQSMAAINAAIEIGETPDLDLYILAATNAYYLGDLVQAREIYEDYLEYNSINTAAINSYANILYKMEDWDLAEEAYRTALELRPMEEYYRDLIRVISRDESRFEEVEELLLDAVDKLGQSQYLMIKLAEYYLEHEDCTRALAHYSVALTLAQNEGGALESIEYDIAAAEEQCKGE